MPRWHFRTIYWDIIYVHCFHENLMRSKMCAINLNGLRLKLAIRFGTPIKVINQVLIERLRSLPFLVSYFIFYFLASSKLHILILPWTRNLRKIAQEAVKRISSRNAICQLSDMLYIGMNVESQFYDINVYSILR